MAKLGWACAGILATLMVVAAARTDDTRTDERLAHIEKVLVADVHPRLFKHAFMPRVCDSDEVCRRVEDFHLHKVSAKEFLDGISQHGGSAFRDKLRAAMAEKGWEFSEK